MPNVAMPHSQEGAAGVNKTAIGFMKLEKPVSFDENDPEKDAQLFFTLASCNPDQHLNNMMKLSEMLMNEDVVKALAESGYTELAENILNMLKQRVIGDYMHTAAILDEHFQVMSGVNTPNDYMGPGTGYRVSGKRWEEIKAIPHRINVNEF